MPGFLSWALGINVSLGKGTATPSSWESVPGHFRQNRRCQIVTGKVINHGCGQSSTSWRLHSEMGHLYVVAEPQGAGAGG